MSVRPASGDDSDIKTASAASKILASANAAHNLDGVLSDGAMWSEITGSVFYKITWNDCGGRKVGSIDSRPVFEGDVKIEVCPPYEIYPDSPDCGSLGDCRSLIHARAVPVADIERVYGVKVKPEQVDILLPSLGAVSGGINRSDMTASTAAGKKDGCALVIERYTLASEGRENGTFEAVAGGKLLHFGELPYINGADGARDFPFVKQDCMRRAGCFFGQSMVERLIPLQRAYNAVKNRKHEFLNRFALGMLAVEDGSVDADGLEEDGLTPGKVIVYRQGARPPEMMQTGAVPAEFGAEEENLLAEFAKISGTGSLSDNADGFAGITSATGLQLIIDQDETRLDYTYRQIKRAIQRIGRHILRLYRQFASDVRLLKTVGESSAQSLLYFKGSDISSDDVVLEADSESNLSPAQRRAAVYEMLDRGLFSDENGRLSPSAKNRVLELLGYKGLSGGVDLAELNRARAGEENAVMRVREAEVKSYDDHAAHIAEHTAYLLTEKTEKEVEARICAHIEAHRRLLKEVEKDG